MRAILQIRWGNPSTMPPDGKPRVIWQEIREDYYANREFPPEAIVLAGPPGNGWAYAITMDTPPPKKLPEEVRRKRNRTRITNKLRKKYPLFANELIARELRRKGLEGGEKNV